MYMRRTSKIAFSRPSDVQRRPEVLAGDSQPLPTFPNPANDRRLYSFTSGLMRIGEPGTPVSVLLRVWSSDSFAMLPVVALVSG